MIQEFEISWIKNAYAPSVDNSSLIIMIIITVELFFVSVIIFYEIKKKKCWNFKIVSVTI